ncbi:unnamed protein product [Triticum aestivum]|uniref:Chlorophyll a-b binding protein, chloroplastic n=2 Tax=Triticum TaxID=4564 RepID=A0A9R1S5K7_TRITD|nr:unnamed protein product [Triticum aestivum]VAH80560.1 unnamed protein product [Triticum turgidum subsp. durum]
MGEIGGRTGVRFVRGSGEIGERACRLPGDYGFDPLGLGKQPKDLKWYVEAEIVHCWFAMAGVAGILGTDDRDFVVEPMSTTGSTQPSRPDIRSSPSASSESVRARNSGSSSRSAAPPPAAPQAGAANPLRFDAKTIHFSVNAWVRKKPPFSSQYECVIV